MKIVTDTDLTFVALHRTLDEEPLTEYVRFPSESHEEFVDFVCDELKAFGDLDWREMINQARWELIKFLNGDKAIMQKV